MQIFYLFEYQIASWYSLFLVFLNVLKILLKTATNLLRDCSIIIVFIYILKKLHIEVYLKQVYFNFTFATEDRKIPRPKINNLSGEFFLCLIYLTWKMDVRYLKAQTLLQMRYNTFMKCIDFIFNWIKTYFTICYLLKCS